MLSLLAFAYVQLAAPQEQPHEVVVQRVVVNPSATPAIHGSDSCLPMKLLDGLPIISVNLAGRQLKFGFDTGAPGGPLLDPTIIKDLKLAQVGEAHITDPSMKNVLTVGLYELRDLAIGNFKITWVATSRPPKGSHGLAEPDGIIGLTAFVGYIVTIDYPGGRLLLTKGRLPEPDGRRSFRYQGPIPRVPLTVDGQAIDAHIDTGNARYALILPESFATQLSGFSKRFPIGVARTVNNKFDLMALPVRDAKVGDFPIYAGTAAFPSPARFGNIGSPILRDMVVKVDPANSIVTLERAPAGLENGCPTS